jgi:hypothetical protein
MSTIDKVIDDLVCHEINKFEAKELLNNLFKTNIQEGNKKQALKSAVNSIYFSDSSNYRSALYSVIRHLLSIGYDDEININALFDALNQEN